MLRYLSADVICSEKRTVFRERSSRKKRELRGTDNVQGQISEHIFKVKWRLLCLLSFKYFSQNARSASLSYVNHVKVFQLASKISTSFNSDFASVESICLRKKYIILKEKSNSVKDKRKIRVGGQGYRESNHLSRTRSKQHRIP